LINERVNIYVGLTLRTNIISMAAICTPSTSWTRPTPPGLLAPNPPASLTAFALCRPFVVSRATPGPSAIAPGLDPLRRARWRLTPLVQPLSLGNSRHPDGPRGFPPAPRIPSGSGNGDSYTTGRLRILPDNYPSTGNLFRNTIKMRWLL